MDFNDILSKDKPVLVDFHADWCGPCQTMEPILEEVISKIPNDIQLLKIDVDKHPMIAAAFQVRSVPTFIFFRKGEIIWRKTGLVSLKELETLFEENS